MSRSDLWELGKHNILCCHQPTVVAFTVFQDVSTVHRQAERTRNCCCVLRCKVVSQTERISYKWKHLKDWNLRWFVRNIYLFFLAIEIICRKKTVELTLSESPERVSLTDVERNILPLGMRQAQFTIRAHKVTVSFSGTRHVSYSIRFHIPSLSDCSKNWAIQMLHTIFLKLRLWNMTWLECLHRWILKETAYFWCAYEQSSCQYIERINMIIGRVEWLCNARCVTDKVGRCKCGKWGIDFFLKFSFKASPACNASTPVVNPSSDTFVWLGVDKVPTTLIISRCQIDSEVDISRGRGITQSPADIW